MCPFSKGWSGKTRNMLRKKFYRIVSVQVQENGSLPNDIIEKSSYTGYMYFAFAINEQKTALQRIRQKIKYFNPEPVVEHLYSKEAFLILHLIKAANKL